jgi:glucokinase
MTDDRDLIGAIDIGGTKVAIGLVTLDGQIKNRRNIRTDSLPSGATALDAIESSLNDCLREAQAPISCIGIGCTGPVDPIKGAVGNVANLPGWQGLELVDELAKRFSVPVAMENDADAAALAEATWGSGIGIDRFLYVTLSTGIGTGFLVQGQVYRGVGGAHPEMGHHTIDPSGPKCYCGTSGCWESLASGNAIREWYLENDLSHRFTTDRLDAETIFELYRAGDPLAGKVIDRLGHYVGLGLANLTTILVPELITIGGGLTLSSDIFLDRAVEIFRGRCHEVPAEKTTVRTASLQKDVGLAGAAAVWVQRRNQAALKEAVLE